MTLEYMTNLKSILAQMGYTVSYTTIEKHEELILRLANEGKSPSFIATELLAEEGWNNEECKDENIESLESDDTEFYDPEDNDFKGDDLE